MKKIIILFFSIALFSIAHAEVTGTINFSFANVSVVSGLTGYTVNLCNSTSNCLGHACFLDYDNVSTPPSYGWCNSSVITSCYHNNSEYATGTSICITNVTYSACSSGSWPSASSCSSGQTCPSAFGSPGNCTASSSSSSSTGGSSSTANATDKTPSIIFTSIPADFSMVQGESVLSTVIVKNNGNATLYNITLSVSLTWSSVSPAKWNQSIKNNETAFAINFTAPADAAVKTYAVTLEANTHNASVKASKSFYLNVKPSNATVQGQIFPEYDQHLSRLSILETNLKDLEAKGADVEELKSLLLNVKSKLSQANQSLEKKDYFAAKQLLDDAKGLLDAASEKVSATPIPQAKLPDFTFMIILAAIAGVIVFVVYMLLPPRQKKPQSAINWNTKEKKSLFKRKKGK